MFNFLKDDKVEKIEEKDLICPRCNLKMNKKFYGEITLDICKNCGGSWFDKKEVEEYIKQREKYNLY